MILVKAIFCLLCCSSIFQTLSGVNSTSKQVTSDKTPDALTSSKCHNVYFNNYYSGPANKDIKAHLLKIENQLAKLEKKIDALTENKTTPPTMKNCAELYKSGQRVSGVYTIDPDGLGSFDVFCDQKSASGGWTVFQKRLDGSVDFNNRGWGDYKRGFGNLNGEFWLGLDKIHRLTKTKSRLRVELEDTQGKTAYAEYDMFSVSSERNKYRLGLGKYSGTAGDSLSYHRNMAFSTKDRDNDNSSSNCAAGYNSAWWYNKCVLANLNGYYYHGPHTSAAWRGINWYHWRGHSYSAKRAEMKIRPVQF
ncbi:microfibril-associated glycoprotein 4-like [Stylophora pistillata]|uniref:microfibril-associated glycoprotein 4-like n=1 Tax=Stylophora pistillata TaxID=50429 RepID=UPI000C041BCE|nr:microfibril-associated glycoprotein 4-like [Stylophora pistillata]